MMLLSSPHTVSRVVRPDPRTPTIFIAGHHDRHRRGCGGRIDVGFVVFKTQEGGKHEKLFIAQQQISRRTTLLTINSMKSNNTSTTPQ